MGETVSIPKPDARFRPRADRTFLARAIESAWTEYLTSLSDENQTNTVKEALTFYFENAISASDLEVLTRHKCVSFHDRCNVRVYDSENSRGAYAEAFGFELLRKVPSVGTYGYPSICACEPEWGMQSPLRGLDGYFASLLQGRKAYLREYKESLGFPDVFKLQTGVYPTWGEIEAKFPVLAEWIKKARKG